MFGGYSIILFLQTFSSIRDEQLLYTLLLDKEGKIISDAYVLCDNEHYFLISEWMNSDAICQQIKKY